MQGFQNTVQDSFVLGAFISLLVPKQSLSEPCLNSAPMCGVWWSPLGLIPTLVSPPGQDQCLPAAQGVCSVLLFACSGFFLRDS